MTLNVEWFTPGGTMAPVGPYSHIAKVGQFIKTMWAYTYRSQQLLDVSPLSEERLADLGGYRGNGRRRKICSASSSM